MFVHACNFAAEAHRDQRRKNKDRTPYINHPLEVAYFLSKHEDVDDQALLAAAVLHDVVEDTTVTLKEIRSVFGERVARLVSECSDNKKLPKVERKKQQIEHMCVISNDAKRIKMADKLSNLLSLVAGDKPESWTDEIVRGYMLWSLAVVREMKDAAPRTYYYMCSNVFELSDIDVNMSNKQLNALVEDYYALLE